MHSKGAEVLPSFTGSQRIGNEFDRHGKGKLMVRPTDEKMTCDCPNGHKLRGPVQLIGKQIVCPGCKAEFIFGETYKQHVSDTAVVRILGSAPEAPYAPSTAEVMRPCSRCGVSISASANVCTHCDCYIGAMPDYMKSLLGDRGGNRG